MSFKISVVSLLFILIFTGCIPKQEDVKGVLQSDAAISLRTDSKNILKLLLSLKMKLDKRNPNAYDKTISDKITKLINSKDATFYLAYGENKLDDYKDYLQLAFSKDNIQNRNDYLILGIYYLVYESYDFETVHKILAMQYDKEKLEKLFKNLQLIKWKIKTEKDLKNNYLFLTWQNNWQIELAQKMNQKEDITYKTIENLHYIKSGKESLFDHSNFSFEVLLTRMIDNARNSLRALGEEPKDLAIETLGMFLFL